MNQLDDDLMAALRAARPDPGYQPSATSPEARAMLARVLRARADRAAGHRLAGLRWRPRPLLLAGLSAVVAAAVAAALVTFVTAPPPAVARMRAAVLDALKRSSGDIVYATRTIKEFGSPTETQRIWTYPAWPASGQQVRFRVFDFLNGVPAEDTESIYVSGPWSNALTRPTTEGPHVAEIIDVEYATRTWSRALSPSALLADGLSPAVVQQQIASGGFTVAGTVRLQGRRVIELTWPQPEPPNLVMTTRLWVDARTYLPLRSVTTEWIRHSHLVVNGKRITPGRRLTLSTDTTQYQILPATRANLAFLSPPVPAGFTRTAHSPRF